MVTDETGAEVEREECGHYVGECSCDDATDCFAGGSVEDTSVALLVDDLRVFLSRAPDRECTITYRSGLWRVLLWVGADYYEGKDDCSLEAATRQALGQVQ